MNRKLLNGLLVLAVAAGGVGTFTSCKDDNFRNEILLEQDSLEAKLAAIRSVSDATFKQNLEKWLNDWTAESSSFSSYEDMLAATDAMYDLYKLVTDPNISEIPAELQPFCNLLYDWIYNDAVSAANSYTDAQAAQLQEQIDELRKLIESLKFSQMNKPTSLSVNNVFNPVFGNINLPVGINSTVLATYIYEGDDVEFSFPAESYLHMAASSPYSPDATFANMLFELSGSVSEELLNNSFTVDDGIFGNMGGAVLAINPTINDFVDNYVVEIVNSEGEAPFSTTDGDDCLTLAKYDGDLLTFGASRAEENNLYKLQVNATEENYGGLVMDIDKSAIIDAVKTAYHNKTLSNIAHLGEVLFKEVNGTLPAYAVKLSWNEGTEEAPVWNSIYSDYDLAATVLHPLSYNSIPADFSVSKRVPVLHNTLSEYLESVQNKLHFEFNDIEGVDPVDFNVEFMGNGMITIDLGNGNKTNLYYSTSGVQHPDANSLNAMLKAIFDSINTGLNDQINDQIIADLNKTIDQINEELSNYAAQLGDFNTYLENIKNSRKLTYAQKLVDIYNKLAEKANQFLADPSHYMQVMAAYSVGDGAHHLSNDVYYPTRVVGAGDGLELIISSYTGDVLTPSYKKYVAITGVVNPDGTISTDNLASINSQAGLNRLYPGGQQKCVAYVAPNMLGQTYRLSYISVDYRGMCSMENYYVTFE